MIKGLNEYKNRFELNSADTIQLGLEGMEKALNLLDYPQKELNFVHVTGTNGKGSTISFVEMFAMKHGLTVGKFTSPCIVDVHDQIQVNGETISTHDMDKIFCEMKDKGLSGLLTDFELLTCAAFLYFHKRNVDLVLLEVGMGGREDSTNVIEPICSIITSISLEHQNFLGSTLESIAYHKAGIIKQNKPVVIGKLPKEAQDVIEKEAREKNSTIYKLERDFTITTDDLGDSYTFPAKQLQIKGIQRKLMGLHQGENMSLAITAFLEVAKFFNFQINVEKIIEGAKEASVPSRFEKVRPNLYFDGAHNPDSAKRLAETIQNNFPNEKIRFVVGMVNDKDSKEVLSYLEQVSDEFYFVNFENDRALPASILFNLSKASKKEIIKDSISFLKQCEKLEGITVVTGSLYLLSDIRTQILAN